MAEGKKQGSITTLGMSMLKFGRNLMRHYETPTASQQAKSSMPYQSMATPTLNWDGVMPSVPNIEEPLSEEAEMPFEELESFTPTFQEQRRMPPKRPTQQRQQRPAQAPVQRKAQTQKPSVDSRLQRILDFHKQREAEREVTRQERRRVWEESQGLSETSAPEIPGWKPKQRASFDYIETSSLAKGGDEASKPSETKSDPIQRQVDEKPEKPVHSQILEQNELSDTNDSFEFGDDFIEEGEPFDNDILLNTDDMDTVPMNPIVSSSSEPIQRRIDTQETVDDSREYPSETTSSEQRDSFSQYRDDSSPRQLNRPSHERRSQTERPQSHQLQRRSQEQAQMPEQSHETQESDSGDYEGEDDSSDSSRLAVTGNKSSPVQRQLDDTGTHFSEPAFPEQVGDDDYPSDDYQPDIERPAPQSSVQRFPDDTDDWQDEDDWQDDAAAWDDNYSTDDYQPDIESPSRPSAPQSPIQRFPDDTDNWQDDAAAWDDNYSTDDYQPDIESPSRPSAQNPVQRFSDDEDDWQDEDTSWDDNYSTDDYQPDVESPSRPSAPQNPVQRFSDDEDDWQDEDTSSDNNYSSDDYQPDVESPSRPSAQSPIQRRKDATPPPPSDSEAGMSSDSGDFPIVQRSMGADGNLYYNVVESDDVPSNDEQDIDVYQALLDAGIVETGIRPQSHYETAEQGDNISSGDTPQSHSQAPIQRQTDEGQTVDTYQNEYSESDNIMEDSPTIQRQMGADGKLYYNASEEAETSLPEQAMDLYQGLVDAGMISAENALRTTSPSSDAIQRTSDDTPLSSIGIPQNVQDAMLQRLREMNKHAQQDDTQQTKKTKSESSHSTTVPLQTPIQRTYSAEVQRKPPIPDTIMRDEDSTVKNGGEDMDKLARDVYRILQRRLRDEAERRNRK